MEHDVGQDGGEFFHSDDDDGEYVDVDVDVVDDFRHHEEHHHGGGGGHKARNGSMEFYRKRRATLDFRAGKKI